MSYAVVAQYFYQSHFLFDLKLQFINGYSKHRNDWILSLKIRVAIPQSSVLNYCSDLIIFPCFSQARGTSDNVSFAIMIPQIHFCYLNCHTDTFNQLLHLHVSRLRSSISYHLCPKCNIGMEFGFFKADRIQKAPCIDSYYYFNTLQIIDLIYVANCNLKVRTNHISRSWSDVCHMKLCMVVGIVLFRKCSVFINFNELNTVHIISYQYFSRIITESVRKLTSRVHASNYCVKVAFVLSGNYCSGGGGGVR